MAMSAMIKSLEDIMRKDAGLNGDAQYIEQITWLLFLKAFDAKEMEWEIVEDNYKSYTLSAKYTYTGSTSKPVTNLGNFILSGTVSNNGITNITETGTSYDAGLGSINAKTTESTLAATA